MSHAAAYPLGDPTHRRRLSRGGDGLRGRRSPVRPHLDSLTGLGHRILLRGRQRRDARPGKGQTATAGKLTLADGTVLELGASTRITRTDPATPADLRPGLFVAIT